MSAEETRPQARRGGANPIPTPVVQTDDVESRKQEIRNANVGGHVLHALGKPGELLKVQVRPLWEKYYRVNVFVGTDAAGATIAHSYFVIADGDGNVLSSTPKVERKY
jgi:hypothetical protein